jgi:hypothetical protein
MLMVVSAWGIESTERNVFRGSLWTAFSKTLICQFGSNALMKSRFDVARHRN